MDTPKEEKGMYEASNKDIFFKNFLVGFGRGIGGFAVQLVLFFVVYLIFLYTVMPKIQPLLNLIPSTQTKEESQSGVMERFFGGSSNVDTPKRTN